MMFDSIRDKIYGFIILIVLIIMMAICMICFIPWKIYNELGDILHKWAKSIDMLEKINYSEKDLNEHR